MGKLIALNHKTNYKYDKSIQLGSQTIRLKPAPHTRSHIQSYSLKVTPANHFINWQQDPFGNYLARLVFPEKTKEFKVEVDLITEIRVFNPFDFFLEEYAETFPFTYPDELEKELAPYLEIKEKGKLLNKIVKEINKEIENKEKYKSIDFLVDVNQKVYKLLKYLIRLEPGIQSCEETLELKSGSCRDMAWLLCQIFRHLGLATRFASGYLIQLTADEKSLDGPSGPDEDFTDLHAWTEVYLPGAGWIGLDATSGLFAGEGHIPLCASPNPSSAAPISGALEDCKSSMEHEMSVKRICEEKPVAKPYTEAEWKEIDQLAYKVDRDLESEDVRLTMGGEPTFVSLDDRSGKEWHFTALSENKSKLALDLLYRLKNKFSDGACLQFSQGKWYPGEELPRWSMNCTWRKDLEKIWKDETLLARPDINLGHNPKDAKKFLIKLTNKLGIPDSYIIPAFESEAHFINIARGAFVAGKPIKLEEVRKKNINKEVAFVLPLHHSPTREQWISNKWEFFEPKLRLIVGDSPAGLRLPLSDLPYVETANNEFRETRCPFDQKGKLATYDDLSKQLKSYKVSDENFKDDPNALIKSALCTEVRNGIVHVFLAPTHLIEHGLELLVALEETAKELNTPIVIEGYPLAKDLRVEHFSVTPDPGVIEVNIQPSFNWDGLKNIIFNIYEEARKSRLSTEKFMLDGRRVGTGGGNHIVMGAANPEDSPFLRRPNLLRSFLAFWQNHPSLSYLFSAMYIGPTSQFPRVDEARHDSLYELEIAFKQIDNLDTPYIQPWLVDRLFRNLLVDLTGNTHRAEFCIDKLYSPDSNTGRLGLLEMRGFEMTPHPQMNLLQALLVRAALAAFWKKPYKQNLINWGTLLHDKYMLPTYLIEDFSDVLNYLSDSSYHFQKSWFEPFFNFRFPKYGEVNIEGIKLELRMALEPWPVMGEEANTGGTSRAVDSSVERLEVKLTGVVPERHVLTCNGIEVPLKQTREKGASVAAVRFKAWAPYSSLHPNIDAHGPLIFDLFDKRYDRSIGGCTYHVSHPGGRNYDSYPVNDNEAKGRILSRFEAAGHSPGEISIIKTEANSSFPHTLDLRLYPNIRKVFV